MRLVPAALCCVFLGTTAGPAGAAKTLPGIHSPSGNISCLLVTDKPEFVICEIGQASYTQALRHHCGSAPYFVDWAGFSLGTTGKGGVACAGGMAYEPSTEHPRYTTLPYGSTWHRGGFSCRSETSGITCTNRAGHSMFVSRGSWHVS